MDIAVMDFCRTRQYCSDRSPPFRKKNIRSAENMSSLSLDTSCRSSANTKFDLKIDNCGKSTNCELNNITETFESLRVNDDSKNVSSKNDVDKVECRDKLRASSSDNKEDVNNNDKVTINSSKDNCNGYNCLPLNICVEEERRSLDDLNFSDEETEQRYEDFYDSDDSHDSNDSHDSDLVAKGPIKPDYQHQRIGPYVLNCLLRTNDSVTNPTVDYDKTAEQIMKNKDYSEKLNPCLDKLSSLNGQNNELSIGAIDPSRTEENGDFRSGDPSSDTPKLPFILVNEMRQESSSLLNFASQSGFQSAQTICSDTGNHSIPSPRSTLSDSSSSYNVISRSNSRASSCAQSPGSATNSSESPQMPLNIIGSPLGSPQVAYRVPQALLSSSSSNQSSASNQSYSDASSPLNYQTPLNYQFEEQFSEILCSGDSSGTINGTDELQLIEEIIKDDQRKELKELKESQITPNVPHFSSSYNNQHEYPASNTQNKKPIYSMSYSVDSYDVPNNINNFRTDYMNTSSTSADKKRNSLNYCMLNSCVSYSNLHFNQIYYDTNIKNSQVGKATYHGTLPNIALSNNGRSVKMTEQNLSQKMSQATSNEKNQTSASTLVPNNSQAPTIVPSSSTPNHPQRKSNTNFRPILPWHLLKLPSVSASERLKEILDPEEVVRAMSVLAMTPIEKLTAPDKDGYTQLMCLMSNPEEFAKKKAYLVPMVERMDNTPGALEMKNKNGENALFLAAMNYPEMSYICGYLAAVMLHKGIDINKKLDKYSNTLMHCIAARGDSHGEVLAEMLKLLKGNSAFDISSCNIYGETALHLAVKEHLTRASKVKALATTRLLLENGVDPKAKENLGGDTALHLAVSLHCDPALIKILLNANPTTVNERNYSGNTPLHIAAEVRKTVDLEKQKEVCRLLIGVGGSTNIRNNDGNTPLALVPLERKEIIKKILHRKL